MFNTSGIGINLECIDGLINIRASAPPSLFVSFKLFLFLLIKFIKMNLIIGYIIIIKLRKTLVACSAIGITSQEMTSQARTEARIS